MECQLFHVQYLHSRNDSLAYINIVLENSGIREQNQSPVAWRLPFAESEPRRIDFGADMPAS